MRIIIMTIIGICISIIAINQYQNKTKKKLVKEMLIGYIMIPILIAGLLEIVLNYI